jgi:hypothetical protein
VAGKHRLSGFYWVIIEHVEGCSLMVAIYSSADRTFSMIMNDGSLKVHAEFEVDWVSKQLQPSKSIPKSVLKNYGISDHFED